MLRGSDNNSSAMLYPHFKDGGSLYFKENHGSFHRWDMKGGGRDGVWSEIILAEQQQCHACCTHLQRRRLAISRKLMHP